jgi:hypothetical protein
MRGSAEDWGRFELIEPFHVQGYGTEPLKLWDYVYALCAEKYDMGRIGNVYLYGDREKFKETARWIADATFHLMPEGRERAVRLKTVGENSAYILTHWDAIQNIRLPGSVGSCIDALGRTRKIG